MMCIPFFLINGVGNAVGHVLQECAAGNVLGDDVGNVMGNAVGIALGNAVGNAVSHAIGIASSSTLEGSNEPTDSPTPITQHKLHGTAIDHKCLDRLLNGMKLTKVRLL